MLNIGEDAIKVGSFINKIYIPPEFIPPTGFGEIRLMIEDGKIVDCKITTSIKFPKTNKIKKE